MARKERKKDELLKASDALYYEIGMFKALARGLSSGISGDSVIHNALLESFLIHTRVLLDFLYPKENRHPDDIIAADFFADPEQWEKIRNPKTDLLETVSKRVAKEVAHLSYTRLSQTTETKQWNYLQIAEDVVLMIDQFLGAIPSTLLGSRWAEEKRVLAKIKQDNN